MLELPPPKVHGRRRLTKDNVLFVAGFVAVLLIWSVLILGYVDCVRSGGTYVRGLFTMECM